MSINSTISVNPSIQFSEKDINVLSARGVTQNEMKSFQDIMEKAGDSEGYKNPKEFLHTLSIEEMKLVQKIHCLANSIEIDR